MHHKFSLLYYVLLDFDNAGTEVFVSETFSSLSGMPANYQLFMKGLWYMDREEYHVSKPTPLDSMRNVTDLT